jgi:protein-disulfide isomerase-like protein with CxxC motif
LETTSRKISVTLMADPACPWAYSALPAISALRWRYGDQLDWRVVTIGLAEAAENYERRGYTPALMSMTPLRFARFGMPFALAPRPRVMGTGRACRAIVAARLEDPELAYLALRALHLAWFTTDLLLDEDEALGVALRREPRLDADAIVGRLDAPDVEEAYQRDRAEARSAAGSPSALQDRTAQTDGVERYTAPTLVFEAGGTTLEAGGHQSLAAYDVLVANLDPGLRHEPPAEDPLEVLRRFPHGLTTREVAVILADRNDEPDDRAAAAALLGLAGEKHVVREPLGGDALWRAAQ